MVLEKNEEAQVKTEVTCSFSYRDDTLFACLFYSEKHVNNMLESTMRN